MSDKMKCPYFGRCGGCNIIDKPYARQLEQKKSYVNEQLKGYAAVDMVYGMEKPFHYRNKVHVVISQEKVSGNHNKKTSGRYDNKKTGKSEIVAGIYEEESHRVVPVEECLLHDTYANEIIKSIVDIMKKGKFEPYDEDRGTGCIRHILIRRGHITKETMVVIVTGTKVFPGNKNFIRELLKRHSDITTIVHNVNDKRTSMVLGQNQKTLYGKGYIEDVLCGLRFRISPKSFYQINSVQTELLYEKAIEFANLKGNETVIDAYCGIGTISMVAAKRAGKVIGVELNRDAVRDAKINARINNVGNVEFYNDDAGKFMEKTAKKVDTVFIDPPRSGSDEKFLGSLIRLKPEKIVYVSCNVETQRRDLGVLSKGGYKVEKACAVDLFPGTNHVETVVMLSHKKPDSVINVKVEFGEGEGKVPLDNIAKRAAAYKPKERVTYKMIKEYIEAKYGFKVHTAYIAEIKWDLGLPMYDAPNAVEELKQPRKHPTAEKVEAIKDALKYFEVI